MTGNRSGNPAAHGGGRPRWLLILIALPAAVAIWSGWVGLGGLCGFGPVNLLPGITNATLNTAITLPVGVEAYAAYALAVWLWPQAPKDAKKFAGWSALGALGYGMLGQVAYHLLATHGYTRAPAVVVVLVSCMPVAVLGLAAALTHLLRAPEEEDKRGRGVNSGDIPKDSPAAPVGVPVKPALPTVREVREDHGCGPDTEKKIRRALRARDRQWAQVIERSRGGAPDGILAPAPAAHDAPAGKLPPLPAGASNGRAHG